MPSSKGCLTSAAGSLFSRESRKPITQLILVDIAGRNERESRKIHVVTIFFPLVTALPCGSQGNLSRWEMYTIQEICGVRT